MPKDRFPDVARCDAVSHADDVTGVLIVTQDTRVPPVADRTIRLIDGQLA